MKKTILILSALLLCLGLNAQKFNKIPRAWKWVSPSEVAFTYDGTFEDSLAFSVNALQKKVIPGRKFPAKYESFPINPKGAKNMSYSPDSSRLAYTLKGNLFVVNLCDTTTLQLTQDGSELIRNGHASWVYFEEIFGRPADYRSYWWSPDSKKIAFYRYDNSGVPMFPIYSPFGQDGRLNRTRYPKAGEKNPEVMIGMVDLAQPGKIVWADFDEKLDQYFGIPFWSADSKDFFVSREPRRQNTLDLYAVSSEDGTKKPVYHEEYPTWLEWMEDMLFTKEGLYMARDFETGWQQIYFLSYDGKTLRRLTDGPNWNVRLLRTDEKTGDVFFTAKRDVVATNTLYKVDNQGNISALTDTSLNVANVQFSEDGRFFVAMLSNFTTPNQIWLCETSKAAQAWRERKMAAAPRKGTRIQQMAGRTSMLVADLKGPDYDPKEYALPQIVKIKASDGLEMPGAITYPKNFDPAKKYPVHVEIYGGPGTAYVRNMYRMPSEKTQWWSDKGIINIVVDGRVAGHNGRAGLDLDWRDVVKTPVEDFVTWAHWLQSLPYVQADKIGVEGFSFGGTMTCMLLFEHSDCYHYGIAGGGVYDWLLYDTHYTERFMDTPQANPEGYEAAKALNYAKDYPVTSESDGSVRLKITHGTGDDNVHFQNTLQLIDVLQREGKSFDLMVYPDGMHGYRGAQGAHSTAEDQAFWKKYLLGL